MPHEDPRVASMFRRDCASALFAVVVVWAIYAFTFLTMRPFLDEAGLTVPVAVVGAIVLFLNTAAIVAMIRHYDEDRAAIYGIDIHYLDALRAVRAGKGADA